MHQDCTVIRLGLKRPSECDRMALRHVGSHYHDRVRVDEIAWESRGTATTEGYPQTGDCGGVSYPCLVFKIDHTQGMHQFLMGIVPLIVNCRTA